MSGQISHFAVTVGEHHEGQTALLLGQTDSGEGRPQSAVCLRLNELVLSAVRKREITFLMVISRSSAPCCAVHSTECEGGGGEAPFLLSPTH